MRMLSKEAEEIRFAGRTEVSSIRSTFRHFQINEATVYMNKKSSMSALIARTASKTRTKQSGIKIRYIYDVTPGPAPHYQVTPQPSTPVLRAPTNWTPADIVVKNSHVPAYPRLRQTAARLRLQPNKTGKHV